MSDAIRVALESAIRTYEAMSPGVMTVDRQQAIDALQALQSGGSAAGEVTHELTYTYDDEGYCTGKYMKGVVSDEIFKLPHGTKLYTTPQPAVPCLTFEDLNLIRQWRNAVKDAYPGYLNACDADTFAKIEALLSAGKGANK